MIQITRLKHLAKPKWYLWRAADMPVHLRNDVRAWWNKEGIRITYLTNNGSVNDGVAKVLAPSWNNWMHANTVTTGTWYFCMACKNCSTFLLFCSHSSPCNCARVLSLSDHKLSQPGIEKSLAVLGFSKPQTSVPSNCSCSALITADGLEETFPAARGPLGADAPADAPQPIRGSKFWTRALWIKKPHT